MVALLGAYLASKSASLHSLLQLNSIAMASCTLHFSSYIGIVYVVLYYNMRYWLHSHHRDLGR